MSIGDQEGFFFSPAVSKLGYDLPLGFFTFLGINCGYWTVYMVLYDLFIFCLGLSFFQPDYVIFVVKNGVKHFQKLIDIVQVKCRIKKSHYYILCK